jgi:hypothetical protein
MQRGVRHMRWLAGLLAVLVGSVALVLLTVEDLNELEERDLSVPFGSQRLALLQLEAAQQHLSAMQPEGLTGAISALRGSEGASKARLSSLAHSGWLQDIYGKDTTYDMDFIKNLQPGDVSEAGYEGFPQEKGGLPSPKEHAAADALLQHALDTDTMPADIENPWDGQPYVPDEDLQAKLSRAWAGFHQAVGEKRWEKKVKLNCGAGAADPACAEVLGGKHEGYDTKWDGEEWTQWDGEAWNPLEPDE